MKERKQERLGRKALRASFVATVSLAGAGAGALAGGVGCGNDEPITTNPPSAACPTEQPKQDETCVVRDRTCNYGDCNGVPTIEATCADGTWDLSERSCNPPGPELPAPEPTTTCPQVMPSAGELCGYSGPACVFARCAEGEPGVVNAFSCVSGVWDSSEQACAQPQPQCPLDAPANGASCTQQGLECSYGDCAGSPTTFATCGQAGWEVAEMTCNPPPPPEEESESEPPPSP